VAERLLQGLKANLRRRFTSGLKPRPPKEEEIFWGFGDVGRSLEKSGQAEDGALKGRRYVLKVGPLKANGGEVNSPLQGVRSREDGEINSPLQVLGEEGHGSAVPLRAGGKAGPSLCFGMTALGRERGDDLCGG
jgi:hypothetical protein